MGIVRVTQEKPKRQRKQGIYHPRRGVGRGGEWRRLIHTQKNQTVCATGITHQTSESGPNLVSVFWVFLFFFVSFVRYN